MKISAGEWGAETETEIHARRSPCYFSRIARSSIEATDSLSLGGQYLRPPNGLPMMRKQEAGGFRRNYSGWLHVISRESPYFWGQRVVRYHCASEVLAGDHSQGFPR